MPHASKAVCSADDFNNHNHNNLTNHPESSWDISQRPYPNCLFTKQAAIHMAQRPHNKDFLAGRSHSSLTIYATGGGVGDRTQREHVYRGRELQGKSHYSPSHRDNTKSPMRKEAI